MFLKLNEGICKKISQPNFGSLVPLYNVAIELDPSLVFNDVAVFHIGVKSRPMRPDFRRSTKDLLDCNPGYRDRKCLAQFGGARQPMLGLSSSLHCLASRSNSSRGMMYRIESG